MKVKSKSSYTLKGLTWLDLAILHTALMTGTFDSGYVAGYSGLLISEHVDELETKLTEVLEESL